MAKENAGMRLRKRQAAIQKPSEITITKTQTEIYPPQDQTVSTKGVINAEWRGQSLSRSVSQRFGQSASGLNGQEQEGNRFDLFVIGLQGVINRPEVKQHLRLYTLYAWLFIFLFS